MENNEANKLDMKSANIINNNIEKIGKLFPNAIIDGKIDFEVLKQELTEENINDNKEKYQLTWVGKKNAIINANTMTTRTLRPCKEKSVNYESTKNVYIEGDNLDALKILQESYLNKIKLIYIDPPYNTGSDLIYNDSFDKNEILELQESGLIDEYNNRLYSNQDSNGRFHSEWISMMYSIIKLSRTILNEEGIIFLSIDDNEVKNILSICNEIFGEKNYIGMLPRITKKSGKAHSDTIAKNNDYIIIYAKDLSKISFNGIEVEDNGFSNIDEYVEKRGKYKLNQTLDYDSLWYNPTMDFELNINGEKFYPGGSYEKHIDRHNGNHNSKDWVWRWSKAKFDFGYKNGFVEIKEGKDRPRIYTKTYLKANIAKDANGRYYIEYTERKNNLSSLAFIENEYSNDNAKKELDKYNMGSDFDFPKPSSLIKRILELVDNKKDFYALDFFSGSGTLADAVMQFNSSHSNKCKFILVQLPEKISGKYETICDIGEERIRRASKKIKESTNADIDYGFRVYKVDSSNMKDVYYEPSKLNQAQLNMFESNIKEDRTAEDLLTQVILDLGLTLDLNIEEKDILNNKVYFVAENSLVACFDSQINIDILNKICEVKPLKVVFRESSFRNDSDKINAYERIKKLSPETEISVI